MRLATALLLAASLQASTADVVSNVGGNGYIPSYTQVWNQGVGPLHKEYQLFGPNYLLSPESLQVWHDTPYYVPVVIPDPEIKQEAPKTYVPYVPDWTPLQPVTCADPSMPCAPPPQCVGDGCSWWTYDPPSIAHEPDDPSSAVPEPQTWGLMLTGAGVIVIRRMR